MHGTYDSKGVFHVQRVHLGVTESGRYGLFTGNTLAHSLDMDAYVKYVGNASMLRQHCQMLGFELED